MAGSKLGFSHILDPYHAPPASELVRERLNLLLSEQKAKTIAFFDWAQQVPEPKGPLNFKRFPFQRELYQAGYAEKELVIQKGTQVGISAMCVRWLLFWCDTRGATGLYLFPRERQLLDFSDARIRPLILGQYLRERVPPLSVMNKGLKQIGLGYAYFRGSESEVGLESIDADVIVMDEYDLLVPQHVPVAERRISGSVLGLIRRVGVPTVPGWGVSKMYDESDQRRWRVKCGACGEWQPLTFGDNVIRSGAIAGSESAPPAPRASETKVTATPVANTSHADGAGTTAPTKASTPSSRPYVGCRKCTKPLDVGSGEWVAEFPDREVRGYHVTRLLVPNTDLRQIVRASEKTAPHEKQSFYNRDLGEPYAPEEGRLSIQAIAACQRPVGMAPGYTGLNPVTMGVDVASVRALNVRISEHVDDKHKQALWIGEVQSFDDLPSLVERFSVNMIAIDHLPEGRLARAFAERYAGRVYLVNFATNAATATDVLRVDDEQRRATVRRVEGIDAAFNLIRTQRNLLPLDLPETYVAQMMAPIRIVEKDELGRTTVAYRSTGPDDYAMAEVYDVVATELWYLRQHVEAATRVLETPLENLYEFKRSDLTDPDSDYSPGFEETDEWSFDPQPERDEWGPAD